jgi:hypothetical protein
MTFIESTSQKARNKRRNNRKKSVKRMKAFGQELCQKFTKKEIRQIIADIKQRELDKINVPIRVPREHEWRLPDVFKGKKVRMVK